MHKRFGPTGIRKPISSEEGRQLRNEIIFLFILCVAFFREVIFAGKDKIIAGFDIIVYHYYARAFTRESIHAWSLPKWNPYEYGGMPFAADPGNAVFYPLNKFFLFMPISNAISLNMVFHLFLAGVGALLLARSLGISRGGRLIAAISFMLSGYFIDRMAAGHEIIVMCSAYLPWIFLACESSLQSGKLTWCIGGGIFGALQILTGASQPVLYTWLFLSVYVVFRDVKKQAGEQVRQILRGFGHMALMGILSFGFSAIQLIPSLELVFHSERSSTTMEFIRSFSFPPGNFLNLLFPYLDLGRVYTNWEYSCYVGILPLTIALAAVTMCKNKRAIAFTAVAVFALAIMLARYNPLFPLMTKIIPGLSLFRVHARAGLGLVLALAMLSGFGWDKAFGTESRGSKMFRFSLIFFSGFFLAVTIVLAVIFFKGNLTIHFPLIVPGDVFGRATDIGEAISSLTNPRILFPIMSIVLAFLASLVLLKRPKRYLSVILMMIVLADLFTANFNRIQMINEDYLTKSDMRIDFIRSDRKEGLFRVWLPDDLLFGSRAKYFKICSLNGYSSLMLMEFRNYIEGLTGLKEIRSSRNYEMSERIFDRMEPLVENVLNIKYYAHRPGGSEGFIILRNSRVLPRARLVTGHVQGSPEEFLASRIDHGTTVFLHDDPPSGFATRLHTPLRGEAAIDSYTNDEILLSVDAPENGFLVLSEIHYPGWRAEVDGTPAPVLRGNYLLRVVPVTHGKHRVRVFFAPKSLWAGAMISLITLVSAGMAAIWNWHLRRQQFLAEPRGMDSQ